MGPPVILACYPAFYAAVKTDQTLNQIKLLSGTATSKHYTAVPLFHKARTSFVFPGIPVLLCVKDVLSEIMNIYSGTSV